MSTRKQLTIVAVAALIVSVSFLYGVEPSVGMASNGYLKNVQANASASSVSTNAVATTTPTTITITTSNTNSTLNTPFTLSGALTANGVPLSGRFIWLNIVDPSGSVSVVNTTTTDANGTYTITRSESTQGLYYYQAGFNGGGTYPSSNATVKFIIG